MQPSPDDTASEPRVGVRPRPYAQRLIGAPISWGAFTVPGWGRAPVPRGQAAAPVAQSLHTLDEHGFARWLVLEQDTAITADEPAVNSASMLAARESIEFLNSAHRTEEIDR